MEKSAYVKLDKDQQDRVDDIREMFAWLYGELESKCKKSRETELGFNRLEEAQSWFIKGISRESELLTEDEIIKLDNEKDIIMKLD